jgi:hypothetical protein
LLENIPSAYCLLANALVVASSFSKPYCIVFSSISIKVIFVSVFWLEEEVSQVCNLERLLVSKRETHTPCKYYTRIGHYTI